MLDRGHLQSPFSLAEVRVLYEIAHWAHAHGAQATATDIGRELGLDPGYLSRILRRLQREGFVERGQSPHDARRSHVQLTLEGTRTFANLETRACGDVAELLTVLDDPAQRRLVDSLRAVETILAPTAERSATPRPAETALPYKLRAPRAGDLGWVVARHGALYAQEYGWDQRFEALVARIVADFVERYQPERERCWIAERGGENVGSVFLVRDPEREGVAKLRLLLVEPSARGLGLGRGLVYECTGFAREAGYNAIMLWTNSVLVSARRIYEAAGYRLLHEDAHHSFGHDLVGQTWELTL